MKLLTFYKGNQWKLGVSTNRGVLELPQDFEDVLEKGEEELSRISRFVDEALLQESDTHFIQKEDLHWGPCVPNPGKIICVGLNYQKHAEETNSPIPEYPILFNKFSNTITSHNSRIVIPKTTDQLDYEAELVIVIGKEMKNVDRQNALDYVLGYCIVNDLSARDLQFRTNQWLLGKTCDDFSPIGPYLVTADEIVDPNNLFVKTYVNGELRQNSNTSDMIFDCSYILRYISQYMTLSPGDIILTGTPEGVVLGNPADQQQYLKDGDTVTIEIEGLGVLRNTFISEK
ncbi:fumarylacetoacetate hydrolase family protein [Bacillus haimaensis]|uniref:fumarylacetoacetate hydrolase family protein n=1 Tax=Bacillus haimaensis TaxID=3160967 RepID=UPI003AA8EE45